MDPVVKLTPNRPGFHLEGDGNWDVQIINKKTADSADFFGYLVIKGFRCSVFITPDGEQWAQKSLGEPAPKGDEAQEELMANAPDQIASQLQLIASKLENSKNPRRDLIVIDLQKIIAALDDEPKVNLTEIESVLKQELIDTLSYLNDDQLTSADGNWVFLVDDDGNLVASPTENNDYKHSIKWSLVVVKEA